MDKISVRVTVEHPDPQRAYIPFELAHIGPDPGFLAAVGVRLAVSLGRWRMG
jgi:hypothetical protein